MCGVCVCGMYDVYVWCVHGLCGRSVVCVMWAVGGDVYVWCPYVCGMCDMDVYVMQVVCVVCV